MSELSTIGFIGLGTMGQAMARNLIKGGFAVGGYDIAEAAMAALAEAAGRAASSPREAAEGADLVIAMLPNTPHVEQALQGADGVDGVDVLVNAAGATFEVGVSQVLFEVDRQLPVIVMFDITADGQRFIIPVPTEEQANLPITIVTNWQQALVD